MAWVRRELNQIGIPPLKRFGQHFLIDRGVRERLVNAAQLSNADTVLEVGPGLGFLTSELASKAGVVIAIEKDRTLADYLKNKFLQYPNVQIDQGDALSTPIPSRVKIVSSPPYNISSKLTLHIIASEFSHATLLLQEEFVKRLIATSGSKEYGRLTVMLQVAAEPQYIERVSRSAFYPRPRVDSALVTLTPRAVPLRIEDRANLTELVRTLFTQRRRRLRGVLMRYLESKRCSRSKDILSQVKLTEKRVYELSPQEFVDLSNLIAGSMQSSDRESESIGD
ncbi:MAG TPA: 16S rRNA (adenine(1518)-N(6)/adenine(1519)-N(6))-dimethyltransferase RsmA [Terriglobales bacterium]|nr:16S rRNA (adenine(1518)-N(6)/adenine(1519)-N(6))-dimethyltransferase RsmA [Terriglobales bacterium]